MEVYEVVDHCFHPGQRGPGNICRSTEVGDYRAFRIGTKLLVLDEGGGKDCGAGMTMALYSGHIGDFDVFVAKDVITVINEKRVVLKHRVPGLSRFLAEQQGRVRLTLGRTEDFTILGLWGREGFGYAVNLDDPALSEWGSGWWEEERRCERPSRGVKP